MHLIPNCYGIPLQNPPPFSGSNPYKSLCRKEGGGKLSRLAPPSVEIAAVVCVQHCTLNSHELPQNKKKINKRKCSIPHPGQPEPDLHLKDWREGPGRPCQVVGVAVLTQHRARHHGAVRGACFLEETVKNIRSIFPAYHMCAKAIFETNACRLSIQCTAQKRISLPPGRLDVITLQSQRSPRFFSPSSCHTLSSTTTKWGFPRICVLTTCFASHLSAAAPPRPPPPCSPPGTRTCPGKKQGKQFNSAFPHNKHRFTHQIFLLDSLQHQDVLRGGGGRRGLLLLNLSPLVGAQLQAAEAPVDLHYKKYTGD